MCEGQRLHMPERLKLAVIFLFLFLRLGFLYYLVVWLVEENTNGKHEYTKKVRVNFALLRKMTHPMIFNAQRK